MGSVTKSFVFDSDRDADLLAMLEGQGPRGQSALVRQALRTLLEQHRQGLSASDIEEIARVCRRAVRSELAGRLVVEEQAEREVQEALLVDPESEAAKNLARIEEDFAAWE